MVGEAAAQLGSADFSFAAVDAQAMPFGDRSFDAVIANHMLYHVPDLPKALAEARRVLRSDGALFAATNGRNHMRELYELVRRVEPDAYSDLLAGLAFSLENGRGHLAPWFARIDLRRYEDALVVNEAEPLCAYIRSSDRLSDEALEACRRLVAREIAERGSVRITKDAGLFVASP